MQELITIGIVSGNYTLKIYDNNGSGSFVSTPRQSLVVGASGGLEVSDFAIGDINDDNLPDIVACANSSLKCFLNDGTGYFDDNYQTVPSGVYFRALVLTNLDYDQFPDLVILCTNTSGGGSYLKGYLNSDGVFNTSAIYTGTVISPTNYIDWLGPELIATDLSGLGGMSLACTGLTHSGDHGFWVFKNHGDPPPCPVKHFTLHTQGNHPVLNWDLNSEMDMGSGAHYRIYRLLTTGDYMPSETFTLLETVDHDVHSYTDVHMYLNQQSWNCRAHYFVTAVDIGDNESLPTDTLHCAGLYHENSEGDPLEAGKVGVPCEFSYGVSPNPFNPTTTISFGLPEASLVTLKIYDSNGRQVAQLVNSLQPAGVHQITFDGSSLPSGLYLYRLTAGQNTASGKMVLLK
jgi:hypothetical protein